MPRGGQRQRLAVATAKISQADVVIFDEPMSGLDFESMQHMGAVIRDCAADGAVVIVVTHDRELIEEVGDRELRLSPSNSSCSASCELVFEG